MDPAQLAQTMALNAERIRALAAGVAPDAARWKPDPETWSILEVVNHLYDEERLDFRVRLDIILHRPEEPWPRIDPQGWVTERRYNERELAPSLEAFLAERSGVAGVAGRPRRGRLGGILRRAVGRRHQGGRHAGRVGRARPAPPAPTRRAAPRRAGAGRAAVHARNTPESGRLSLRAVPQHRGTGDPEVRSFWGRPGYFCYSETPMPCGGTCAARNSQLVMLSGSTGQFPFRQGISEASRCRELRGSCRRAARYLVGGVIWWAISNILHELVWKPLSRVIDNLLG